MSKYNKVAILLCSKNGSTYIYEQLCSFINQTYKEWTLWVSDDGSSDETCRIVSDFISGYDIQGVLIHGPQKGFCENFLSLVCNDGIQSDYYAFSDQDDIWMNDKLERAVSWLDTVNSDIPALFCSRTSLIGSLGENIGFSPNYIKPPAFGNSLVQNIASGNTMVFNNKARELLKKLEGTPIVAHDWTLYQIVTGCGGQVHFDHKPTVFYRQHSENVIGNNSSLIKRFNNFVSDFRGRKVAWNDRNFSVLSNIEDDLINDSKDILSSYKKIRTHSLFDRITCLNRAKVYHQNFMGRITLLIYAVFNKI